MSREEEQLAPEEEVPVEAEAPAPSEVVEPERDYLDDLMRLQAEFENYRKRTMKEQVGVAARASERLIERLLPVIDNFELAIAHGEGGSGAELAFKELMETLGNEGLEVIESDGADFDPKLHEAVESHDSTEVDQVTVTKTYRRGYLVNGRLLRAALVVVARPVES
jgi:molecular chaperone GrpE